MQAVYFLKTHNLLISGCVFRSPSAAQRSAYITLLYGLTRGMKDMLQNVADLDSGNGKTYREINNETNHKIKVGKLVQLDCGARLYVLKHSRDCDGTPLYVIGLKESNIIEGGYSEDDLKAV